MYIHQILLLFIFHSQTKERKRKLREEEYETAANVLLTTSMDWLVLSCC